MADTLRRAARKSVSGLKSGDALEAASAHVESAPGAGRSLDELRRHALREYVDAKSARDGRTEGSALDEALVERMRQALLDYLAVARASIEPVLLDREIAGDLYSEMQQHFSGGSLGAILSEPRPKSAHRPAETHLHRTLKRSALAYLLAVERGIVISRSPTKDVRIAYGLSSEGTVRNWRSDIRLLAQANGDIERIINTFSDVDREDVGAIIGASMKASGLQYQRKGVSKKAQKRSAATMPTPRK